MIRASNRKKACKTYGCRNLHTNPSGWCDECMKKYRAKHPEKYSEEAKAKRLESQRRYDERRGSASSRGYDAKWTAFAKGFLKAHPLCAICGEPAKVVDHKDITADMMMDAWGKFDYDESHYQPLCVKCNVRKGLTEDEKMRRDYQEMKARLYEMDKEDKK